MADVATPLVGQATTDAATEETRQALDACDLVDAMDLIDNTATAAAADADFDAFGSARTLEGETLADAQAAAAAEQAAFEQQQHFGAELVSSSSLQQLPQLSQEGAQENTTVTSTNTIEPTANNPAGSNETTHGSEPTAERNLKRFVTPKDFELLKVIGMGAFGRVLQVKNKQSGQILAMKVISKRLLKRKAGYIENVNAERSILKRVQHAFVVTMHCSFQSREKLFIIMDFLAGGELFLRLGREGIFREKEAAFYLGEMILGVDHLHGLGILHRDLKPENILLGNDGHICLTDFGLAKDFGPDWNSDAEDGDRANTICGTQEYMAPEMVARKGYGKAADYWSLGCIAYEMLNGLPPFSNKQGSKELFRKIMSEKVKMPPGSTAAACKLLKGLLNRNPDARLGCARSTMFEVGGLAGLKQAPFFNHIDWGQLERKELKPPYDLTVDNEHDLRNFHNDFTSMPLPRSVKDMTAADFLPRRIDSQAFRGFSFIQPSFEIPDRNEADIEGYWKAQADGDGESDSDVASSKFGEEIEAVSEPTKKKRPPRKRKKKKKDTDSVATASPPPSEAGDISKEELFTPGVAPEPLPDEKPSTIKSPEPEANPLANATEHFPSAPLATTTPVSQASALVPTPPQPKAAQKDAWQSVGRPARQTTPPTPIQGGNRLAASPADGVQLASQSQRNTPPRQPGDPYAQTRSQRTVCTAPPGSWAARIQTPSARGGGRNIGTPSSTVAEPRTPWSAAPQATATPRQPSLQSVRYPKSASTNLDGLPSPSSNWRQHSSPQVTKALIRSTLRTSPKSADTSPTTGPAWPSLKDAPGTKQSSKPTPKVLTSKTLQGAWASRAKS